VKVLKTGRMKRHFLFLLLPVFLACNSSSIEKYTFHSNPAFFGGFKMTMDSDNNEIEIALPSDFFVSDTISSTNFRVLDSIEYEQIKHFVPQDIKFKFPLTQRNFEKLKHNLELLTQINVKQFPPNDGITIAVEKLKNGKHSNHIFYSPDENSQQGKLIVDIYAQLEKICLKNNAIEDALENSQRHFINKIIKVKSTNPLYVKILEEDCDALEVEIAKLPKMEKIYLDVTNTRNFRDNCLEKLFRNKYSKIAIVSRSDFFEDN